MKKAARLPRYVKISESIMRVVFILAAFAAVFAVALICLFMFSGGLPAMAKIGPVNFFFGTDWSPNDVPPSYGILPMILGSLYVTAGAILLGVPIGVMTAVYMAEMCSRPLYRILKPAVNLLAGIPSVVYGFFGVTALAPIVRNIFGGNGSSMLTASVLLAIMILPTIVGVSESALRAVPNELFEGATALGADRERAAFAVVLPAAKSGVSASVVLGTGRAIGETMAVKMVAGNQPLLRAPYEYLKGVRTMTANIVIEMGYAEGLHREALIATGVALFVFVMLINLLFTQIGKRSER